MSIASCGLGRDGVSRALYSPRETEAILGVSHATVYRLINDGRLDARKLDGKTCITDESIRQLIASLLSWIYILIVPAVHQKVCLVRLGRITLFAFLGGLVGCLGTWLSFYAIK